MLCPDCRRMHARPQDLEGVKARLAEAEAPVAALRDFARRAHEHGWACGREAMEADNGALISHYGSEDNAWEGFAG